MLGAGLISHHRSSVSWARRRSGYFIGGCPFVFLEQQQVVRHHPQRRAYWFLPTSWTELQLRLRRANDRRIVYVQLLRERARKRYQYLAAAQPLNNRKDDGAPPQQQTPLIIIKKDARSQFWLDADGSRQRWLHRRVLSRDRRRNLRLGLRKHVMMRTLHWKERLVFWRKPITLTEYSQASWFDAAGRPRTSRDATGRFINPWLSESTQGLHSLNDLVAWQAKRFSRYWQEHGLIAGVWNIFAPPVQTQTARVPTTQQYPPLAPFSDPAALQFTWIGHNTCLVQQKNMNILFDPIFSLRASPYPYVPQWMDLPGIARTVAPAYYAHDLPLIDLCCISHDHYDHLDKASVEQMRKHGVQLWIVPSGVGNWLQEKCAVEQHKIVELEWWESVNLHKDGDKWHVRQRHSLADAYSPHVLHPSVAIPPTPDSLWLTCCPAQHWAGRTFWDRNYRLWCSFSLHMHTGHFYFGGDTAFPLNFPLFEQVSDYIGPVDLAALPIGAYDPEFLMRHSHMNPGQAVQVHCALRARKSVAIHWGSFPLSEEPMEEPPMLLQQAVEAHDAVVDFTTIPLGSSLTIGKGANVAMPVSDIEPVVEVDQEFTQQR